MKSIYIASAYMPPGLASLDSLKRGLGLHRERVEAAFDLVCQSPDFELAHDWLSTIDEEREAQRKQNVPRGDSSVTPHRAKTFAQVDLHHAIGADVFWFLVPHDGGRGCWTEFGYVLGHRTTALDMTPPSQRGGITQQIFCSGPTSSIFCHMADQVFATDAQAWDYIARSRRV